MKKIVILFVLLFFAVFQIKAQQKESENPDEQVIVNKGYDKQGNLIQYDSTYVHKWSMDTTYHFGFPGDSLPDYWKFPEIENLLKEFWNDSIYGKPFFLNAPFSFGFKYSPFEGEWYNRHGGSVMPDSLFQRYFPFFVDSLFFDFGSNKNFSPDYNEKFFKDFQEHLNKHFFRFREEHFKTPRFRNEQHKKEWEELFKKHQQEMYELRERWKDN